MGDRTDLPNPAQLSIRGFHLNFESYRRMGIEEALRLIDLAARHKLNTLLVEYGPRRRFANHPDLQASDALTQAEMERLTRAAESGGLQIIPLQQTAAHLEYVLTNPRFANLRERPEKPNLLCPTHPDALPLMKDLLLEIRGLHPQARYIHIGGDEARKLGVCPSCRASGLSPAELYGRHMAALARFVLEMGCRPIVWDDTFCAFPSALQHLPKETIIDYWDYIAVADPTPVIIPRMAHANGGPRVAHHWRWMLSPDRRRLSDVQVGVMRSYSHPTLLPFALGRAYLTEFRRYLGDGFPKWIRA
ncbi:MAG TPA: family 20 glycosylhydrolase, partial [Phycisphaerae bacterium]|nr:family 20 glycosylhydrolase [Phycisphaerae bacterium]